jgi:hypothetical protein
MSVCQKREFEKTMCGDDDRGGGGVVQRCSDTPMDLRYDKDLCNGKDLTSPRIDRIGMSKFFFMTHKKKQLHRKKHSDDDDDDNDGSTYIRPWVSTGKTKHPTTQHHHPRRHFC